MFYEIDVTLPWSLHVELQN